MTASLTCPSCGEANGNEMAFCIFCGAPLKSAKPSGHSAAAGVLGAPAAGPAVGPPPTPTGTGAGVRTCSNCGQADVLSGLFCVFCGARMDGPAMTVAPGVSSLGQPMPAIADAPGVDGRKAGARVSGVVVCVVAGLLGAALGGGLAYSFDHDAGPPKTRRELPTHGLVILTASPFASFKVVNDGRHFLTGKTGKEGDINIENIEPGEYDVEVKAHDGRTERMKIAVKAGAPTVVGGDAELFAQ